MSQTPAGKRKESAKRLRGGLDPAIGKATQIKPGERRNPSGKNQYTPITEIYKSILAKSENRKKIEATILRIIFSGRMSAVLLLKEMKECIEGKATTPVELGGTVSVGEIIRKARERAESREA